MSLENWIIIFPSWGQRNLGHDSAHLNSPLLVSPHLPFLPPVPSPPISLHLHVTLPYTSSSHSPFSSPSWFPFSFPWLPLTSPYHLPLLASPHFHFRLYLSFPSLSPPLFDLNSFSSSSVTFLYPHLHFTFLSFTVLHLLFLPFPSLSFPSFPR